MFSIKKYSQTMLLLIVALCILFSQYAAPMKRGNNRKRKRPPITEKERRELLDQERKVKTQLQQQRMKKIALSDLEDLRTSIQGAIALQEADFFDWPEERKKQIVEQLLIRCHKQGITSEERIASLVETELPQYIDEPELAYQSDDGKKKLQNDWLSWLKNKALSVDSEILCCVCKDGKGFTIPCKSEPVHPDSICLKCLSVQVANGQLCPICRSDFALA